MIKTSLLIIGIILTSITVALIVTGKSKMASIISAIFAFLSFFISLNPNLLNEDKIVPSIVLNYDSLELISTDEYILEATIIPNNSIVNWNSNNEEIVTIDSNGHLKAINEGDATITAKITYNNIEYIDTCNIKVRRPIINLYSADIFFVGDTKSFSVSTIPEEANVIWNSNNTDIVTVNNNGEIRCIAEGTATITAIMAYNDQNYSAYCDIKVNAISGNDTTPSDILEQNGDIEPEPVEPEPTEPEPVEPEPVASTLAFSDDVKVIIDPNAKYIFNLNGYVSSNYELSSIKFDFKTPECRWPYGATNYKILGPKEYYLNDLNETINVEAFNFGYKYNGNFELIITVEDSSGNIISKTINWSY